jgi:uncharacterized protein YecE (DUF72 family)
VNRSRNFRHAVEVRHASFETREFIALARAHEVAIIAAADSPYPQIADPTAPFVYARIMGTTEAEKAGYSDASLDLWTERIHAWASGETPHGLNLVAEPPVEQIRRDVFLYVISGFKEHNPAAAMALIERTT